MKTNFEKIENLAHLKKILDRGACKEFCIKLGPLRSSKYISYNPDNDTFFVYNLIDDSDEKYTSSELFDTSMTNIGDALKKGLLFLMTYSK